MYIPTVSSSGGGMYALELKSGDQLDQSKTFHFVPLMKSISLLAVCVRGHFSAA